MYIYSRIIVNDGHKKRCKRDKKFPNATQIYYDINRKLKCDGFICGRVTMQSSFAGDYYPDLSKYEPTEFPSGHKMDFMLDDMSGFCIVQA